MDRLIDNGLVGVFEGANLPTTLAGQKHLREKKILYIPGKACNAGGVSVSGFEMSQNAMHLRWTNEEVDAKLKETMQAIYNQIDHVKEGGECTLEEGANRAGFLKVASAMKKLGWIW